MRDKSRRTTEIVEVLGYDRIERQIKLNALYEFHESEDSTKNKVRGQLKRTVNPMRNTHKLENAGINMII